MSLEDFELTGNETPEEIEAMLDQLETDELEIDDAAEPETKTTTTDEPTVDNTEESASSEEEAEESGEDETPKGVQAKDGENIIPYDVLEQQREANKQLQQQLEELQAEKSGWQDKERLFELRNKQLEELGVDPADLPENFKVTDEQLDALADDYPDIGKVIRGLVAKVNTFEQPSKVEQSSQPQEPSNPVADAIAENSDLSGWKKEGGDLWNKAIEVDDQLQTDPKWQDKPLAERFAEVAKVVKEQTAQATKQQEADAKQKAKQEEDNLSDALPNSPSEVGQTTTHQRSNREILESGSDADIEAVFSGMNPAQIEALLSEFDT
ncbi:hypothetical protein DI392_00735 [Vibrio albus]|uniref:Uncharacterized protein n=1 Tax=Vibrio albus TaxID=2200953 RepID=A0A2U3BDI7_9VIBR|nr:hypothetical protein [Vibrio albus]PWI34840.1 hypothetical protein DI392_00735 [Vibrio albus]